MDMQNYLSRDLRQVIAETLKRRNTKATKELIEDIYDLVMTEAADAQYLAVNRKIDAAIERLSKRMKG